MVKFGERLPRLMVRGWELQYIDYESLKKILESDAVPARMTELFLEKLASDIRKVDRFVEGQLVELRSAHKAARGNTLALEGVTADLNKLRRFVGTNLIAATKIVKKHDKGMSTTLQKREKVAALILSCASLKKVPAFQEEILGSQTPASPLSVAVDIITSTTASKEDDEDDSEQGLRSLPAWLINGASSGASGASQDQLKVINSYVSDWSIADESAMVYEPLRGGGKASASTSDEDDESSPQGKARADRDGGGGDDWGVDFSTDAKRWDEMDAREKAVTATVITLKLALVVLALYAFICSLSFLADGFRLVAGRQAGEIFRNSEIFNNPVAGMLVGVLVTVLVQSSSTSTSIVITMVAADLLTVKQAISLIMGANIGTSVTSTIVALSQSVDRGEFRRAFAAATVHDMFNFLTVLIFLPLEAATGYLYHVSLALINASPGLASGSKPPDILKALTKPFTKLVISLDKKVITKIAVAKTPEALAELENARLLKHLFGIGPDGLKDGAAGVIVLIGALLILCVTLFTIVWTLKSLLKGRVAVWLHRSVNGHVPDLKCGGITIPLRWLSGYLAMTVGVFVTICVQSSSITTSALTPLVGVGVITVERMYPTVLGANIGTCITGVLAALAADSSKLYLTLQVAYSHLLFNISGIAIWYGIWPLRAVPISAAKFLGNTTAKYRWFALAYLACCFFIIPGIIMGISLASSAATIVVITLVLLAAAFVTILNVLQARKPSVLPAKLRTWAFAPPWMTSLEPLDRVICGPLARTCCTWLTDKQTKSAKRKPKAMEPDERELSVAAVRLSSQVGQTSAV